MLAGVERHAGGSAETERSYAEAVAVLEPLDTAAADPAVQRFRGALLIGKAGPRPIGGSMRGRCRRLRRAVEILGPYGSSATADPPAPATDRGPLGDRPAAAADRPSRRGGFARCRSPGPMEGSGPRRAGRSGDGGDARAATVGYGRLALDDRAAAVRDLDLDLAAECLRMAVELGFRDFAALGKNPDSSLLLSRDDLRPVLRDIAFPEEPFGADQGSK